MFKVTAVSEIVIGILAMRAVRAAWSSSLRGTISTLSDAFVEVILDNTSLYNNITEIITREYAIMNEIQSY